MIVLGKLTTGVSEPAPSRAQPEILCAWPRDGARDQSRRLSPILPSPVNPGDLCQIALALSTLALPLPCFPASTGLRAFPHALNQSP